MQEKWGVLKSKVHFTIENGRRVKFWLDKWYGDALLKVSIVALCAITSLKDLWVANMWKQDGGEGR